MLVRNCVPVCRRISTPWRQKRLAYAKPLQSAVKSYLAQRNWDAAEAIMRDENFSKFLTAQGGDSPANRHRRGNGASRILEIKEQNRRIAMFEATHTSYTRDACPDKDDAR